MRGDLLAVMSLPLALDPHDPDPGCVNAARDEAEEAQDDVDPEIDAEPFGEPDGDGWEEEAQDEAHDLGWRVFAHLDVGVRIEGRAAEW